MRAAALDVPALPVERGAFLLRGIPLRRRLEAALPPLADPRFWLIQALIAVATLGHDAMERLGVMSKAGSLYLVFVSLLFMAPVLLAAVSFGRAGAVRTGLWSLTVCVPNLALWHSGSERYGELLQMIVLNGVAVLTGFWVDAEANARRRADAAGSALLASEARYRGLFETAGEPVLLLDGAGMIHEANAAACRLLGLEPAVARGSRIEGTLLAPLLDALPSPGQVAAIPGPEFVLRRPRGQRLCLQPTYAPFAADNDSLLQVVLRDVTQERRRQAGLEAYAARVLEAQEEERSRIAREIHDGTIHDLVLLCRRLDQAETACAQSPVTASQQIGEAREFAGTLGESLRNIARDLRPSVLDDLGLAPAVRRLLSELESSGPLQAELRISGESRRLPAEAELALFRIAQEALRNAERHSRAAHLKVELEFEPQVVRLRVRDDGAGFSVPASLHELAARRKLGLLGMSERARTLGAAFDVCSQEGCGTAISVALNT